MPPLHGGPSEDGDDGGSDDDDYDDDGGDDDVNWAICQVSQCLSFAW